MTYMGAIQGFNNVHTYGSALVVTIKVKVIQGKKGGNVVIVLGLAHLSGKCAQEWDLKPPPNRMMTSVVDHIVHPPIHHSQSRQGSNVAAVLSEWPETAWWG